MIIVIIKNQFKSLSVTSYQLH